MNTKEGEVLTTKGDKELESVGRLSHCYWSECCWERNKKIIEQDYIIKNGVFVCKRNYYFSLRYLFCLKMKLLSSSASSSYEGELEQRE